MMPSQKKLYQTQQRASKKEKANLYLFRFSVLLWFLSLVTPAFYNGGNGLHLGLSVLLFGIPFGWLALMGGLAVYANIFYWLLFFRTEGKIKVVLMVLLAGCSFVFEGYDLGGGLDSVYSWGWGAIIWGVSLILMAIAALCYDKNLPIATQKKIIATVIALVFLPVIMLRTYQYSHANELERTKFLPLGAAFTVAKLSGISFKPLPENIKITEDTVIELLNDIDFDDFDLVDKEFFLQTPIKFKYKDEIWQ